MCNPVLVGMAIGAGMSAIQGGGIKEIAIGAAFGAVGGAAGGALGGAAGGATGGFGGATAGGLGAAGGGLAAGVGAAAQGAFLSASLGGLLTAPKLEFPGFAQQTAQVQQFNSQEITTSGSGGKQAAASLAESIRRAKKRDLTQQDVDDLSIDTESFAPIGLQLA
jgi:hypothetical protein